MRLPSLTAPVRVALAVVFGVVALGLRPATEASGEFPLVDAQAVATDVGSPSNDVGNLPFQPVADADLFRPVAKATSSPPPVRRTPRPPWWNPGTPRVDAISQLDGGPFQNLNCVMASGAMLARLAYGIQTTGSELRGLQDDFDGGTSLDDLQTGIGRGWHVKFSTGALTTLQLRKLLYAGAGALVIGNYSQLPMATRLSTTFTGSHAVYVDAFRAPTPGAPAAYYVIDPLGNPAAGYRGGWWPADVVEGFAASFGGGLVDAAWAFAHGDVPLDHPILPRTAYPTGPPPAGQPVTTSAPSAGTN